MSVPSYCDLGKRAAEVFRSGYAYDVAKVKLSGPRKPYTFDFDGSLHLKSFKGGGSFAGKYDFESHGEISTKYTFHGPLVLEYSNKGALGVENVDVSAGCSFNPLESFGTSRIGAAYHNAAIHAKGSLTKDLDRSPDLFGSIVIKLSNFFVGYAGGWSTSTSTMTKHDVAVAFEEENLGVHFRCIMIPKELAISTFYKVNETTDVGVDAKMAPSDSSMWFVGVGVAHQLDEASKIKVKFDKNLQLGTSLKLQIQEGLALTLAFSLDLPNPTTSGQHKVGLGLDIL